jgi:4-amino-4-deoxy-L-arabinose transferase-like glycosyltransferase
MNAEKNEKHGNHIIALLILGAILAAGLWLRTENLSDPSFDTDEYLHVLPAREVLKGNDVRLPSGHLYERARLYTLIVAGSFEVFGPSEASARLPSVVFGMMGILATFLLGRHWFGVWEGLAAAALVACCRDLVWASRLCRMYTLFHLLYLGVLFTYFKASESREGPMRRRFLYLAAFAGLGTASCSMHFLTLDFLPALFVYWTGLLFIRFRSRYSLYVSASLIVLGGAIVSGVLNPKGIWDQLRFAPPWAEWSKYYETFYIDRWGEWLPWIWWMVPPAIFYLCMRFRGKGFYVLCQFAVPFLIHSLLLAQKSPRYVSHLFPLLALMVSPFLVWCLQKIAGWAGRAIEACTPLKGFPGKSCGVIVAITLALGALHPPLAQSSNLQEERNRARWREALEWLDGKMQEADALVAVLPLAVSYYRERPATHALNHAPMNGEKYRFGNGGTIWKDWYSGLPVVTSKEALQKVMESFPRGWVVVSRYQLATPGVLPGQLQACLPRFLHAFPADDDSVVIFHWSPHLLSFHPPPDRREVR